MPPPTHHQIDRIAVCSFGEVMQIAVAALPGKVGGRIADGRVPYRHLVLPIFCALRGWERYPMPVNGAWQADGRAG